MEINKLFRISAAFLLAFGWLLIGPAQANQPILTAQQEIAELKEKVNNLTDKTKTLELIEIAEQKLLSAQLAEQAMIDATENYNNAVEAEAAALSQKNAAQSAVDGQTATVATALTNKNNAQDALDIANINLSNTPQPINGDGVSFQIYPLSRTWTGAAYIAEGAGLMCQGSIPSLNVWAGWGAICGLSENIIGIFTTTLTIPEGINEVKFAGYTDDGFRLYVDGVLATSQWQEQGATWSPYTQWFDTSIDKTLQLTAWWYNGGGPGSMHVGWGHSNIWTGIPAEYLSWGQISSQEVIDAYNAAVAAQASAQETYNDKLSVYNSANSTLTTYNQTLTNKTNLYNTAVENTADALEEKENTEDVYEQSIIDLNTAIDNAWNEYNKQAKFEEEQRVAAAIAMAAANQPQPTPEPTPEPTVEPTPDPTPEPTPEQTEPVDPTPEPTPETTDEATPEPSPTPEPEPEPSVEPTPLPEDIDPTPEPEPTQDPVETPDKTENFPISNEMSNLIADLTNSNTLTKLSPEQKAAVAGVLGISTKEVALVAELAKSDPVIAEALEEFGDRANANLDAPMPYTLADATTELQTEAFLADPLGAVLDINPAELLSNFSELGMDMTDDQREKAQEVIIPVVLVSNIVSAVVGMRR